MKTTTWQESLKRWQAIASRAGRLAKQHRDARDRLAHRLLMQAKVGDANCAHNWGCDLPGEAGMLCRRALTLLADWRGNDFAERVQSMAWNRYMTPQGAPASDVRPYREQTEIDYCRSGKAVQS